MALSVIISNRKDKVGSEVSVPVSVQGGQSGVSYTYAAAGLPPGLHINPRTGVIQGTANAPGTYSVDVTATDDAAPPNSATNRITWNIFKSSADLAAVADQTLGARNNVAALSINTRISGAAETIITLGVVAVDAFASFIHQSITVFIEIVIIAEFGTGGIYTLAGSPVTIAIVIDYFHFHFHCH